MKHALRILFCSLITLLYATYLLGQCENNIQYPIQVLSAPNQGDTILISNLQFAGDYCIVRAFEENEEYKILSSAPNDYITIRSEPNGVLLEHGPAPLSFISQTDTLVSIHFNLESPVCGFDVSSRITKVAHIETIIPQSYNVGVNKLQPQATLDINGKLKISDDDTDAFSGMIRFNADNNEFEGYDGTRWKSLIKPQSDWGPITYKEVNQSSKLTTSNGSEFDLFGEHIALDQNILLVASQREDVGNNNDQGRVYVYEEKGSGYCLTDSIDDHFAQPFGLFGNGGLAIKGNYAIIGSSKNIPANGNENGSGIIYYKIGDNWILDKVVTDSQDGSREITGNTVNICPPYAVVGGSINDTLAIFIYKKTAGVWNEIQVVKNPAIATTTWFASHAEIDNNRLFISAPNEFYDGNKKGKIYVYQNNGQDNYQLSDTIYSNSANNAATTYGMNFSVDGDYLAVGEPRKIWNHPDRRGVVDIHHFENLSWNLEQTITAPQNSDNNLFGSHVDLINNEVVVSSRGLSGATFEDHKAFIYRKDNGSWVHTQTLRPSDPEANSHFGTNVALGSNVIFVSDFNDDINENTNQGSVYIYCRQ